MKINEIEKIEEWESLKNKTTGSSEIIIFKYSPVCGISDSVEYDFSEWFSSLSENTPVRCIKINVINSRPLSQHIAGDLQVKHQSPQLIWLAKDGSVKWHASHYDITPAKLTALLKAEP